MVLESGSKILAATSDFSYFMRCRSDDPLGKMRHPVCSVSMTPSKTRLIVFGYEWQLQSIATERNSRVSLRFTQLFLTVSMRLGSWSSNDDLLNGSTEHRLTLVEVEPSKGLGGWLTDVGRHFRLIVLHATPEVTTFWEDAPSGLLRVCDTKQSTADWLWQQVEDSSPLPQREAAGFHFAPLSCFSQWQ